MSSTSVGPDDARPSVATTSEEPSRSPPRRVRGRSRKNDLLSLSVSNESSDIIDPATVTPDRLTKRTRASRRLAKLRELEDKKSPSKLETVDSIPQFELSGGPRPSSSNNDGDDDERYFEVNKILDRRTRKYGSETAGLRHVVEYKVSWKIPLRYTGDINYSNSWLIAENLDQNSLAEAFKQFPMEADPPKSSDTKMKCEEVDIQQPALLLDLNDDLSEDEMEESEDEEVEELIDDDEEAAETVKEKDPDVSHLEDSDYDFPGTVELVLGARTYRVGQSYLSPDKRSSRIYLLSMIKPIFRKAKCQVFERMDECFAAPKGRESHWVMMNEEIVDLALLKHPCKQAFQTFPMKYEQGEDQRSFSYYNESGKVQFDSGKPTALDLYCGAGGFGIGLKAAGFDCKWAVDNDPVAAATLRANKSTTGLRVYVEDVKSFLKNSIAENPCYPKVGEVDHIHASPPCKGFSRANRNGGKNDVNNNKQTLLFVKAVQHFKPKTATFENVPSLVSEHSTYLKTLVAHLLQLNYQVRAKVLTSSDYGDPQRRRRLILIAARQNTILPQFPSPTHGPGLLPLKTCKDALKLFETHDPSFVKHSGSVQVGGLVVFNHIIPRHKFNDKDFELVEDEPSRTILARTRPHVHYSKQRFISVREAASLQSFPLDYQFFGSLANQFGQVGNAVPVKLAVAVSRAAASAHGLA